MLRQTQTSPAVRLRAQASRMGKRTATTQSGAASAMGPAIRQEIYTNLKSTKLRNTRNLGATASFAECIDAAIERHIEPAVEDAVRRIV